MTKRTRRNHTPLQSKVALAAMKGDKTLAELAEQFDVHPNHVWTYMDPARLQPVSAGSGPRVTTADVYPAS